MPLISAEHARPKNRITRPLMKCYGELNCPWRCACQLVVAYVRLMYGLILFVWRNILLLLLSVLIHTKKKAKHYKKNYSREIRFSLVSRETLIKRAACFNPGYPLSTFQLNRFMSCGMELQTYIILLHTHKLSPLRY